MPRAERAGRLGGVAGLVFAASIVGLAAVLVRVAVLQTAGDARLIRHGAQGDVAWKYAAPRGDLIDRRGRTLATTRFEYQPIIDPTLVPDPPDAWVVLVADALGLPAQDVGLTLIRALAENDARRLSNEGDAERPADQDGLPPWRQQLDRIVTALRERVSPPAPVATAEEAGGASAGKPLRRYLVLGKPVEQSVAEAVGGRGIKGLWFERRALRVTQRDGATFGLSPLIGKAGVDANGRTGTERLFHEVLEGGSSRLALVRDAAGRPLWMERYASSMGTRGADVRLSVDVVLQRIAAEELARGIEDADAAGGRIVVIDPRTGELLAMHDIVREVPGLVEYPFPDAKAAVTPGESRALQFEGGRPRYRVMPGGAEASEPALRRQRCLTDAYEPGSTFKSFVWAAGYDAGLLPADEVIHVDLAGYRTPYGRLIPDENKHTSHTWDEVLIRSSNIGMTKISERMSRPQLQQVVSRFGFGRATAIGLRNESPGLVTSAKRWNDYSQTSVSIGHEIAVTPLQMVRAFSAFARTGELAGTLPTLRLRTVTPDAPLSPVIERVLSPEAATKTRTVMGSVVDGVDVKMRRRWPDEPRPMYGIFGKSGTAEIPVVAPAGKRRLRGAHGYYERQYNSSFIAGGPTDDPALVVLCVIDDPGPSRVRQRQYYGSDTAGPVVRRVFERALPYLGIEPVVPEDDADQPGSSGDLPTTIASRPPVRTIR